MKAKITYLFHSGYAIETANHFLVFDYYHHPSTVENTLDGGVITGEIIARQRHPYIFASHNHEDHFDPAVLQWASFNPNLTYVLSSDIHADTGQARCLVLSEGESVRAGDVKIKAFGSSDEGISFLVNLDELVIFHAGDLNWWHWKEDSKEAQESAEHLFKKIVKEIAGTFVDIAFFPVDPRLEEFYDLGARYFAEQVKPNLLVPMHFWESYGITKTFAEHFKHPTVKTVEITRRGHQFCY